MSNRRKIKNLAVASAAGALAFSSITVPAAQAAEIEVTNCNDSGAGSLRAAIEGASVSDLITFDISCNVIKAVTPINVSTPSLVILGPGADELSITNNSATNDTIFYTPVDGEFTITGVTLKAEDADGILQNPLVWGEGEPTYTFGDVEIQDVFSVGPPIILGAGLSIDQSSVHDVRVANADVFASYGDIRISLSSFVGNSIFEGSLVYGIGDVTIMSSAFVDNIDSDSGGYGSDLQMIYSEGDLDLAASYFVEDTLPDEDLMIDSYYPIVDHGMNYFAVDPTITEVAGVTNTVAGTGASALVTREALSLGAFEREDGAENRTRVQKIQSDSVLVDSHTLAQFEVANNAIAEKTGQYLLPDADQLGFRRPSGNGYDAGPYEFIQSNQSAVALKKRNVFFEPMSSELTKAAKTALRKMVNSLPEGATVRRINVTGFVQPAGFAWNNQSLSDARARNVKRFLKTLGVKGQWKIAARGEDKDSTGKARRVKVVVKYVVVPEPT
jgi:outer membrane protein OmpA-like peptidoglycan-associated protein